MRRHDWWGWDLRDSEDRSVYGVRSLATDLLDFCSTGFNNAWRDTTNGSLTIVGTSYFANVYDEETLPCGGS